MEDRQNKVLLDCRFWGPEFTGLGRYTQELVMAMVRLKPKLKLVMLANRRLPGLETVVTDILPYSWAEQWRLKPVIEAVKPDLTHFFHFNLPLSFSRPFVVTIHDLIKHHSKGLSTTTHWFMTYWLKRLGYSLVISKAILKSKQIFVPSRWVKRDILNYYPVDQSKISVTPEAAEKSYFKKTYAQPLAYKYFIYVGNAYPHKNVLQLIKAAQIIAKENPEVKLVIITGRDWFYQHLRLQIGRLKAQNVVKLKDFTSDEDLRSLYHHAVAFVTASLYEGFGLPGLEAMASGTPVLASHRAALPETYGSLAEYFEPDNVNELVAKMRLILSLNDRERSKRIEAAKTYCQKFSWEKTAQTTLKEYERCLGL